MGIEYDYPEYAGTRLIGTCVLLNNQVVYVENLDDNGVAYLRDIKADTTLQSNFKDLSVNSLKLGFINKNKTCYYVARKPKRNDWKQGVRYENIEVYDGVASIPRVISYKDLVQCLSNTYPRLVTCFVNVSTGKRIKQAFSRDFCLSFCSEDRGERCVLVEYSFLGVIGSYNGKSFKLDEQFKYLKERLMPYENT